MKKVVITGSTRGIGYGLARELAARGHEVVISGRTQAACDAALGKLRHETGAPATAAIACDVTAFDEVRALWDGAAGVLGGIDIWINNAGLAHPPLPVWELEAEDIERVVRSNLIGLMYGAKVAVKGMLDQGHGQVYNVSGFGRGGELRPGVAVYGATKRAIDYLSQALALETEGTPVRVGQIHPHFVITDLSRGAWVSADGSEERLRKFDRAAGAPLEATARIVVDKILANRKNGALIVRDSKARALWRRLRARF